MSQPSQKEIHDHIRKCGCMCHDPTVGAVRHMMPCCGHTYTKLPIPEKPGNS